MYTEFFAVWANHQESMDSLNNRIAELKKLEVGKLDILRERDGDVLYVTIAYYKRPDDESYPDDINNQAF